MRRTGGVQRKVMETIEIYSATCLFHVSFPDVWADMGKRHLQWATVFVIQVSGTDSEHPAA